MVDLIVRNGTVVTMNDSREVIDGGAVAIDGAEIVDIGSTADLSERYDADRVVDADGDAVLPGFITPHTHVSDILLRGIGTDRQLYDWLYNVKIPGTAAMTADEHAVASALYCWETVRSGMTTFVEFGVGGESGYDAGVIEAKFDTYDAAGVRNVYAHSFTDRAPDDRFVAYLESIAEKVGAFDGIGANTQDTDEALEAAESLIEEYHGTRDGRQSVWPAPVRPLGTTPGGLRGAIELAETYDVMATTHVAEAPEQEHRLNSGVDYLNNAGFLGDRAVLAHCVHLSDRDLRLLAATDTRVSHNLLTNLGLGDGIARIPELLNAGVTVGVGIDNTSVAGTADILAHARAAAMVHKGNREDAGAITAEKALELMTIDAARAIGREEDLGSIERGKYADVILVDLDGLRPHPNVPAAIVYQSRGVEVETAICHGEVIMEDRRVHGIADQYPDLRDRAETAARDVSDRVGFTDMWDRPWTSQSRE